MFHCPADVPDQQFYVDLIQVRKLRSSAFCFCKSSPDSQATTSPRTRHRSHTHAHSQARYGVLVIDPIALIKKECDSDSEIGALARRYVASQKDDHIVSDAPEELVVELVKQRIQTQEAKHKGVLLLNFPQVCIASITTTICKRYSHRVTNFNLLSFVLCRLADKPLLCKH